MPRFLRVSAIRRITLRRIYSSATGLRRVNSLTERKERAGKPPVRIHWMPDVAAPELEAPTAMPLTLELVHELRAQYAASHCDRTNHDNDDPGD